MNARLCVIVALATMGCATPPRPAPVESCPSAEPALPAPDAALARWKAVVADDTVPPPANIDELVAYLASPDPVRRDDVAYTLLARWIRGPFAPEQVRAVRDRMLENLAAPIAAGDSVFRRTFSVLTLAAIVRRDLDTAFLTDDERHEILSRAVEYARSEVDLRGYTGARGWAHGAAHSGDLLAALAREPSFTDAERGKILDAVAALVVRRHGFILHEGEDGRLAVPVLFAARAGLDRAKLDAWLATIRQPLDEPGGEVFDPKLFAAQRNARNLLFTLFVQASLAPDPDDGTRALLEATRAAIAK